MDTHPGVARVERVGVGTIPNVTQYRGLESIRTPAAVYLCCVAAASVSLPIASVTFCHTRSDEYKDFIKPPTTVD